MDRESRLRIGSIHQILLQLATGNFQYRIERSERNDEIEGLVVTLNMLAEELGDSIVHHGRDNRDSEILEIVQMSFILDQNGLIRHTNQKGLEILGMDWIAEDKMAFVEFLDSRSKKIWKKIWSTSEENLLDVDVELSFKTNSKLLLPKKVHVARMVGNRDNGTLTLVTLVHHTTNQKKLQDDVRDKVIKSKKLMVRQIESTKFGNPKRRVTLDHIKRNPNVRDIGIFVCGKHQAVGLSVFRKQKSEVLFCTLGVHLQEWFLLDQQSQSKREIKF
ncbi:hypothetical protein LX77_03673 [Gelidibacter algens]|uniref:HAMP domain-containing protein n=1 Tax=Gelidibacter algens TaxID=49280 RepID=A0A1A7R4W5_9FLAO|nr:hypothetical protein [Gelidibacter algens]OBX25802.1 hypothetical protein A9996_07675 [Gelidibacter algens]RAJ19134.1 hypothetical protein LX77_03673 [Gelidibacter algens]